MHLRWCRCYTTGVRLGGTSQSFDVRIEHVPRFGAVRLTEFCCRCQAGWYLVCWLLVVLSGRLHREPCGTRSSLHRLNTSSLLDTAGLSARTSPMLKSVGLRRPRLAAAFCCWPLTITLVFGVRASATDSVSDVGVAEYATASHTCDPANERGHLIDVCCRKEGRSFSW